MDFGCDQERSLLVLFSIESDPYHPYSLFTMKLTLLVFLPCLVTGFAPVGHHRSAAERLSSSLTATRPSSVDADDVKSSSRKSSWVTTAASWAAGALVAVAAAATPAGAVSGGGLDYANLDITGSTEFANGNFKGKDFTQGKEECVRACVPST